MRGMKIRWPFDGQPEGEAPGSAPPPENFPAMPDDVTPQHDAIIQDQIIVRTFARLDALLIVGAVLAVPLPGWYLLPVFPMIGLLWQLVFGKRLFPEDEAALRSSIPIPPCVFFRRHRIRRTGLLARWLRFIFGESDWQTRDDCVARSYPFATIITIPLRLDLQAINRDTRALLLHELGHAHQYDWFALVVFSLSAMLSFLSVYFILLFYGIVFVMPNTVAHLNTLPDFSPVPTLNTPGFIFLVTWLVFSLVLLLARAGFIHRRELIADSRAASIDRETYLAFLKRRVLRAQFVKSANSKAGELVRTFHPSFSDRLSTLTVGGYYKPRRVFRDAAAASGLLVTCITASAITAAENMPKALAVAIFAAIGFGMIALFFHEAGRIANVTARRRSVGAFSFGCFAGISGASAVLLAALTISGEARVILPVAYGYFEIIVAGSALWLIISVFSMAIPTANDLSKAAFGLWASLALVSCLLLAGYAQDMLRGEEVVPMAVLAVAASVPVTLFIIGLGDRLIRRMNRKMRIVNPDPGYHQSRR